MQQWLTYIFCVACGVINWPAIFINNEGSGVETTSGLESELYSSKAKVVCALMEIKRRMLAARGELNAAVLGKRILFLADG